MRLTRLQNVLLVMAIALYGAARLCQLLANRLPSLLIVILHVVPPAVFAFLHGRALYWTRGFAVFAASCLGVGALCESLSLRTGVPFGSYFFTGVMGPRFLNLPYFLVLAYLGIAYCSWTLALLLLDTAGKPLQRRDIVRAPLLASGIFSAWDLAMEADWSTVDKAWIWKHGGAYFGVPLSNFAGWLLTAWLFFTVFALYVAKHPLSGRIESRSFWRYPVLLYAICAGGNLLIPLLPMAPGVVTDATGKAWHTQTILLAGSLVSVFVMGASAFRAWLRTSALPQG